MELYFAYGAHLNRVELDGWCQSQGWPNPLRESCGRARLPDMELCFDYDGTGNGCGVLNLRPRRGQCVEGQLFELSPAAWDLLGRKARAAGGRYRRVSVHVVRDSGEIVAAAVHALSARGRRQFVKPTEVYASVIREGLQAFGLRQNQFDAAMKGQAAPLTVDTLFVYGTLMKGEANHHLLTRGGGVKSTASATAGAGMVDLGGYPAAFRAVKGEIQGELVRFRKLEEVLRRVDRLEGFSGYHSDSLYHRAIIQVDAGVERSLDAWVYLLAGSWRDYPVIGSADWRVYRGEVNGADNTNVVR